MLRVYRFVTEKKQAVETSGLCVRKYDISVFTPAEEPEVPGAEHVDDRIIPQSLFHHRRFLSSNRPDL